MMPGRRVDALTRSPTSQQSRPATGSHTSGGGGVANNSGTLTVIDSALGANSASAGYGGGIFNSGTLTVTGSILSGNSAYYGGGIETQGHTLTVANSTLSANDAYYGGALELESGTVTVTSCTLSANSADYGGGIIIASMQPPVLQNTIVAGNTTRQSGADLYGPVQSTSSYNLVGEAVLSGLSNGVNHNQVGHGASALLGPLGDHGGPTQTMPLLLGSTALNAGDPSLAGTPDQRGAVRTGGVTIGAFQASAASLVVSAQDSASSGMPFDVGVAVVDIFGQAAVGYTGTIHFTTTDSDSNVVLPLDYTFGTADGGSVTFAGGVTLVTSGPQTLTATDLASGLTSSVAVTL
jgi:hypothetical protein